MSLDKIFENDNYEIRVGPFGGTVSFHGGEYLVGYNVINKRTGVVEVSTPQYPDAVASAEQLDLAVSAESWKWIRIQQEADLLMRQEDHDGSEEVH